jgi:hypothetical protein
VTRPSTPDALEEDLDLVERTPHAFRGLQWLEATKRLDAAGIPYTPGSRYNAKSPIEKIELAPTAQKESTP